MSQQETARAIQAQCKEFAARKRLAFETVYTVNNRPPNKAAAEERRVVLVELKREVTRFIGTTRAAARAAGIDRLHLLTLRIALMSLNREIDAEFQVLPRLGKVVPKKTYWTTSGRRRR